MVSGLAIGTDQDAPLELPSQLAVPHLEGAGGCELEVVEVGVNE
jgi:hypothetical protein